MDSAVGIISLIVGVIGLWFAYKQYFQKPGMVFRFITQRQFPTEEAIGVVFNDDVSEPIECRLQLTNIVNKASSHLQLYVKFMKNISVAKERA